MTTGADVPKPAYNEIQLLTSSLKGTSFYQQVSDETRTTGFLVFKNPRAARPLRPGPREPRIRLTC